MKRTPLSLALLAALAACGDGQPLFDEEVEVVEEDAEAPEIDIGLGSDPAADPIVNVDQILEAGTVSPPLTDEAFLRGDITRVETRDSVGGGVTSSFRYEATDDTFEVDGLAFDGYNTYTRGINTDPRKASQLGTVAVYHADETADDSVTGAGVGQLVPYVALFDQSQNRIVEEGVDPNDSPFRTSFAIVRGGDFTGFGFGGYAYGRTGDVVLAETGQATFNGSYAGIRVYDQIEQMELTSADINIDIDFDDFNTVPGVKGRLTNRQAFDVDGTPLETFQGIDSRVRPDGAIQMPDLPFIIREGGETISRTGEISGQVANRIIDLNGNFVTYDDGNYFAVIAGDTTSLEDGGEIVGIIKFESGDTRYRNIVAQETGGFIAARTQDD